MNTIFNDRAGGVLVVMTDDLVVPGVIFFIVHTIW